MTSLYAYVSTIGSLCLHHRLTNLLISIPFFPSANNYPYGQFGISSSQLSGDMTSRSLSVSMSRLKGAFGTVQVQLSVLYDPLPLAAYVNRTLQVVFSPNVTTAALSLPVASGSFLAPFAYFTLTITNVTAIIPGIAHHLIMLLIDMEKHDIRKVCMLGFHPPMY